MNHYPEIKYYRKIFNATSCIAEISAFEPGTRESNVRESDTRSVQHYHGEEAGHNKIVTDYQIVTEYHVMLHVAPSGGNISEREIAHLEKNCSLSEKCSSFSDQLTALHLSLRELLLQPPFDQATVVFKRYFVSNIASQNEILNQQLAKFEPCATSIIQQPPLDGSDVALWLYIQGGMDHYAEAVHSDGFDAGFAISHNGYKHFWTANKQIQSGSISEQTEKLLSNYSHTLKKNGCTLKGNCVRTWFFVKNIDINYSAFALARKNYFVQNGLTNKTHYIASTGIEGCSSSAESFVTMDAYSLQGAGKQQFKYLHALSHLSPTYDYGVTFERGVAVKYGDRQQIFISGTASIDSSGSILHSDNIKAQTFRIWENVEALLNVSKATLDDIAQIIVYLRNMDDYNTIKNLFDERFASVPTIITLAQVCRPAWLIEMECIAINNRGDARFRNY